MTRVQQILEAIAAAIDAPGKPAGLVVITSRRIPSSAERFVAVFPMQDKPAENEAPPRTRVAARRFLSVAVVCRCAGSDIDNEILRDWTVSRILKSTTLEGIASRVIETVTDWQGELDSQNTYSIAVTQFLVEYARPITSLS